LKDLYTHPPFNFTAIAANLPASAAMMGNVVVWKPSDSQVFSAQIIIEVFKRCPDGVINVVLESQMITDTVWQVVILQDSTLQDRLMSLKIFGLKWN
jgi:acyl-CoA reductase-like NAD-dependent aldehyde dehydrogenase